MLNTEVLLERLNKIVHNLPCYSLHYNEISGTHRSQHSYTDYTSLQQNIRKIALKKFKKDLPCLKNRPKSSISSFRKHHCLELIQKFIQKSRKTENKHFEINSSKVAISRPHSHLSYISLSKIHAKSPKTKHIKVSIPSIMIN